MTQLDRRALLRRGGVAVGGAVVAGTVEGVALAAPDADPPAAAGAKILPSDPRYVDLTTGNNQAFVARPDYIKMITSPWDAVAATNEAVSADKRVSVRSGGHCFSDFVCNPDIEVILDFSEMTGVGYDRRRRAFYIEPGARLLNAYEGLYKGWGVTIPGGICYSVGAGGHIAGGGYGLLSRAHGLVTDHLYGVDVVTVGADSRAQLVRATREPGDPNRDLWWAHTGGGGGNFGLATRYWFRSPGATGTRPSDQLVAPPSRVLVNATGYPWSQLDQTSFTRLMKNHAAWHEANSAPDSPYRHLSSVLNVGSAANGLVGMFTQVDATVPNASKLMDDYLSAVTAGVRADTMALDRPTGELPAMPTLANAVELPWLQATRMIGVSNTTVNDPTFRGAHKSAYVRQNFTDEQLGAVYKAMTSPDYANPHAMLLLLSFGGQVNAVAPDATALAQRSSVFKMLFQTFWKNPQEDAIHTAWLRDLYRQFFAATGGVPDLDGQTDGCYINYPDRDMADPTHNPSGIPWHKLYYKDNYPRLQQIKARYDPTNFFRHSLSISPAGQ